MKLSGAVLISAAAAAVGPAIFEATMATDSKAGFNGALKLYVGKDCQTNVTTGRICDYRYMQTVTGWQSGRSYSVDLKEQINPDFDQILMTYRNADEAVFSEMKVRVNLGSTTRVINLMNLDGGGDDYLAFDYDTRKKPCGSSYPRGTSCSFDQTFDFYTMKVKPHYSLLRGHVNKRQAEIPVPAPRMTGDVRANTQIKLTTGNSVGDGSDDPVSIYYGSNCGVNICTYTKVASITPANRGTEYSVWLPDFDYSKDQLIVDYRSSDDLNIKYLTFDACNNNGCRYYDLLAFGGLSYQMIALDYDKPEEPCGSTFGYGSYNCQYEAVWDFKLNKKFMDASVFMGH